MIHSKTKNKSLWREKLLQQLKNEEERTKFSVELQRKNNADTIRGNLLCTAQKLDQKGGHSLRSAHRLKPGCVSRSPSARSGVGIIEHAAALSLLIPQLKQRAFAAGGCM